MQAFNSDSIEQLISNMNNLSESIFYTPLNQTSFLKPPVNSFTAFRKTISQRIGIPVEFLRLVWCGKNLGSDNFSSIPDNAFIQVMMNLKGGMSEPKKHKV